MHLLDTVWRDVDPRSSAPDLCGVVRHVHVLGESPLERASARKTVAPRQAPGSDFVEALSHGLALLESWRGTDVWLTNSELSLRSGLSRPTVSRLTAVLVDLGYLVRDAQKRGRLRLTTSTLDLGFGSALGTAAVSVAREELATLARELDVYAALSIRRVDKVQILENVASPFHPNAVINDVGGLLPMCRSTSGLAAMSVLPEGVSLPLILRLRSHYGERWDNLQRHVSRTRLEYSHNGYCTSVAVLSRDVGAVAIPIVPAGSDAVFVLACGMSARDFYPERIKRDIAPRMLKAAGLLTSTLSS